MFHSYGMQYVCLDSDAQFLFVVDFQAACWLVGRSGKRRKHEQRISRIHLLSAFRRHMVAYEKRKFCSDSKKRPSTTRCGDLLAKGQDLRNLKASNANDSLRIPTIPPSPTRRVVATSCPSQQQVQQQYALHLRNAPSVWFFLLSGQRLQDEVFFSDERADRSGNLV